MSQFYYTKQRYGRWITRRVACATIAIVWLLAALISFVPISLGLHRPPQPLVLQDEHGTQYPTCALDLTPTYAVVSSCISFYVPCVVMLGIYCRLYCYAQKHVKSIRAITRPIATLDETAAANSRGKSCKKSMKTVKKKPHNVQSSPYHISDHKAAITVGIIMGVFLVCWVPFFCINIVAAFCKTCIPDVTFKILTWLGYSNSAFNPIIYSIFNTEFREAFKRILTAYYPSWCRWPPCGESCCCCCKRSSGGADSRSSLASIKNHSAGFVTDYGSKVILDNDNESVRQTRVNSADVVPGQEISAI